MPDRFVLGMGFMRLPFGLLALVLTVLSQAGCLKNIPKPLNGDSNVPQVSWVIMHGDRDNPDREYGCQSNPRDECVLPASKPNDRAFSDVHFYYHGAAASTTFTGTVSIGFLERSQDASGFTVNSTVEKGGAVNYQGIIGILTSSPGTYDVTIDIVGKAGQETTPIRERFAVTVK